MKFSKRRKSAVLAISAAMAVFLAISPATASEPLSGRYSGGGLNPLPLIDQEKPEDLSCQESLTHSDATPLEGESADASDDGFEASASNAVFEPRGKVYDVAAFDEFKNAVNAIAASEATEATIRLSADLYADQSYAKESFAGVPGKTVMLSSIDGASHDIYVASELAGGIVLDNVSAKVDNYTIFANANTFETTDRFTGGLSFLYGGGSTGNDVTGDCDIVLRGGSIAALYGGGRDSNVDGNVHITIDAPAEPGRLPDAQTVGRLHGGGHAREADQGRISGDVTIDFRSGSNGEFFGGGLNEFNQDSSYVANPAAMVSGTVTVNFGYKGAPSQSVWPGLAMYSYAGSEYSTVGNVRLNLLDGCTDNGDRDFFACGYSDTVLGTVEVVVEGDVDLNSGHVRFGGDVTPGDYYASGNINILNRANEANAVSVRWNTPLGNVDDSTWAGIQGSQENVPLTIEGDVLIDIESGYLAFVKLDSELSSAVIRGNSIVRVGGDAKIAQIQGNEAEYDSEEETHKTVVEYDGAKATAGYHYQLDEVRVTNCSQVLVDGAPEVFPMVGSVQKPFYSVNDLLIEEGSDVTTRESNTQLLRDVRMDHGTWHAKGYVYVYGAMDTRNSSICLDTYYQVGFGRKNDPNPGLFTSWTSLNDTVVGGYNTYLNKVHGGVAATGGVWSLLSRTGVTGNFEADDLVLQLPVIAEGANYPAKSIPLAIDGVSSGHADVVTVSRDGLVEGMDASAWNAVPVVPTLEENYITSWAPNGVGDGEGQDNPVQAVFALASDVQGPDAYYLKRLPDADNDYADSYYMWQVADGFAVTFDKNNSDEGATEASPNRKAIPASPGEKVALGALPSEPKRPGYVFDGWFANREGSGARVDESTEVDNDVTFYAKWIKESKPDPNPPVIPDPKPPVDPDPKPPVIPDPDPPVVPDPQPPVDPDKPVDPDPEPPVDPDPEPPVDPDQPVDPDKPVDPVPPAEPEEPAGPDAPSDQGGFEGPDKPAGQSGASSDFSNPASNAAESAMPMMNDRAALMAAPFVILAGACVAVAGLAMARLRARANRNR